MKIVETGISSHVTALAHIDDGKILVGHRNGIISLWQYRRPQTFYHLENYTDVSESGFSITLLIPFVKDEFISISGECEIRVWECGSCSVVMRGGSVKNIESAVILPNNLLAVAGNRSMAWGCFDVWDLESQSCIYKDESSYHRPHGMSLKVTAQGFLIVGCYTYRISVYYVDRSECKLLSEGNIKHSIYSMAVLPTGEIAVGEYGICLHKISYTDDRKISEFRILDNRNVIDVTHSVGGYKVLTVDRSQAKSGTIKLWDCITEECTILGNNNSAEGHIVLERESAVLCYSNTKIFVHEFSKTTFHFPKEMAEVRKNARILSQAYRTGTSSLANLPEEVLFKIILLTMGPNLDENKRTICKKIARNYFYAP